jgi:hypothetical protein
MLRAMAAGRLELVSQISAAAIPYPLQGLKPSFCWSFDVAAEAATHKPCSSGGIWGNGRRSQPLKARSVNFNGGGSTQDFQGDD